MRTPEADQTFASVEAFVAAGPSLPSGVVAILLCESSVHAEASVRRVAGQGAAAVVAIGDTGPLGPAACPVVRIAEVPDDGSAPGHLNLLIDALAGRWLLWHWNAEFFVFPFGESRRLADLTGFLSDERRTSLYAYALDLYAPELPDPDADLAEAQLMFDAEGYHAFPEANQQLTVYGGLGWRFHEFLPQGMHQVGRTALFKAQKGVHMGPDMVFLDSAYAAVSCPWHHNPTGAVMSLRRTRRIMAHPNFGPLRDRLVWRGSERFEWRSGQLLELGMIEPGQWF